MGWELAEEGASGAEHWYGYPFLPKEWTSLALVTTMLLVH